MAKKLHCFQVWLDDDEEADIQAFLIERAQLTASAPYSFHDFTQAAVNEMIVKARQFLWSIRPASVVSTFVPMIDDDSLDLSILLTVTTGELPHGFREEKRPDSPVQSKPTGEARPESS